MDGLAAGRVEPIVAAAIARFESFQAMRRELAQVRTKLSERKLVERAKGVLMKAHGMSEEQAYVARRSMAMERVRLAGGRIQGARLCGQTAGEDWLQDLFDQQADAEELGRLLLLPDARPPAGLKPRGRVVCNCWNVGENQIAACARQCSGTAEDALGAIQQMLKCGTQCGSCLPEIRQIAAATRAREAA